MPRCFPDNDGSAAMDFADKVRSYEMSLRSGRPSP